MKMYVIILVFCFFMITIKASVVSIGIQTNVGNIILRGGGSLTLDAINFIEQSNISTNEFEDILIAYINEGTNSLANYQYSQSMAFDVLSDISKSEKVQNYVDSILKSKKVELYSSAYNSFFKITPYSSSSLESVENYIKIIDETSNQRRNILYIDFLYQIDMNHTLSLDIKFKIVKLMLKYLKSDLHNWILLDQELCKKLPSYSHSIQRRNMILSIREGYSNLTERQKKELERISDDFEKAISTNQLIDITDEIINEEIKNYQPQKYVEWEI